MYHDAYATAPHAMLVRIDDSAHFIMLDQPQKFDDAVQTFLKS
jgi:pimeloyl-ACP methyl ester carboxylesterase